MSIKFEEQALETNSRNEDLERLSEKERKILGRMILGVLRDYSSNEVQNEMVSKVFTALNLSELQPAELNIIENVDNIMSQKVIFRVLSELLFLNNKSLEKALELSEWFSLNKKSVERILKDIVSICSMAGVQGIMEKYSKPIPIKDRQIKHPKLEINTCVSEYYVDSVMFAGELDMSDDFDAEFDTYETEAKCKKAIEKIIHKYYEQQQRYVSPKGDRFLGREIAKYYLTEIESIVDRIIDFVNVHSIEVSMDSIRNLTGQVEKDVLREIKNEMTSSDLLYSVTDWKDYADTIIVDEVDDILIGRLEEIIEVTRYEKSNSGADLLEIVQNMEDEINRIFALLKKMAHEFVIEKYMNRINYFVQ